MSILQRTLRHGRLSLRAAGLGEVGTPPFLILFINSICNLQCEHCFYWRNLNRRDDLSFDELVALSDDLGPIENLNLSGGEPFLRPDFAEICLRFIARNRVQRIYVPTNAFYPEKTVRAIEAVLADERLQLFVCELSLDGMPEFHNSFRGHPRSFERAMETYEALAALQEREPRLRIHAISTVTADNVEEIRRLTTYLCARCERMEHHNLALLRGDRKNPSLSGPALAAFQELDRYAKRLWAGREAGRAGAVVDPLLTWAKVRTAAEHRQVVPCKAGVLSGVVYANGDVALCETTASHPPIGNLRESSFRELWASPAAEAQRRAIRAKECYCTNEMFLWPSVTFQPGQLARAMVGARVWRKPRPLAAGERAQVEIASDLLPVVER